MIGDNVRVAKLFGVEVFNTATYIRNRKLTSTLDGRTPYDMVYGAKPDLADMRVCQSPCG